jgi:hypothetical protein
MISKRRCPTEPLSHADLTRPSVKIANGRAARAHSSHKEGLLVARLLRRCSLDDMGRLRQGGWGGRGCACCVVAAPAGESQSLSTEPLRGCQAARGAAMPGQKSPHQLFVFFGSAISARAPAMHEPATAFSLFIFYRIGIRRSWDPCDDHRRTHRPGGKIPRHPHPPRRAPALQR